MSKMSSTNPPSTPTHPTFASTISEPPQSISNHGGNVHLSPILTSRIINTPFPPEQPQYAEDLTPLKLRRKRRHVALQSSPSPFELPIPGPSTQGYTTEEGEVYRGATYDPRLGPPVVDEDALTIGGSSTTSSSSSWSWASDIQRGRRATMAAIGRFGEKIGVRRGSDTSDDVSTIGTIRSRSRSISRRRSRRLSRTVAADSNGSDRPKRQHLPKKREFTLLLPPKHPRSDSNLGSKSSTPKGSMSSDDSPTLFPQDRLITTPSLPTVLDHIRSLRLAAGILPEPPVDHHSRKHSSNHHHSSRPKPRHGHQSFQNPPLPRPPPIHSKSRLEALRLGSQVNVPRPKSVSDLMGIVNPYGSNTSLASLKTEFTRPSLSPTPTGVKDEIKQDKGCWWLDVSCPGWEDLRDIGEVSIFFTITDTRYLVYTPSPSKTCYNKIQGRNSTCSIG